MTSLDAGAPRTLKSLPGAGPRIRRRNPLATSLGELRESFSGGNTIVSGDVNGDGHADFSFALKGHFLLTAAGDFVGVV